MPFIPKSDKSMKSSEIEKKSFYFQNPTITIESDKKKRLK